MASGDQNCSSSEIELNQVCTSTPVASPKFDHCKSPSLEELDVSFILTTSPDRESPMLNHLNITPASPSPFNPDSYSELFSQDFLTAWNNSMDKPGNQETLLQLSFDDSFDTVVEALEGDNELNGYDCPCAYDSLSDGFHTLTAEENDAFPTMAAITMDMEIQQPNFFRGMKDMILDGVKKLFKASSKTFGVQKRSFKRLSKESRFHDSPKDNFNDTMKPLIEVCNIYVSLKTAAERRIYKCLYFLTVRDFRDFLCLEKKLQGQLLKASKDKDSQGPQDKLLDAKRKELEKRMKRMCQQLLYLRHYLVMPHLIQSAVEHSQNEQDDSTLSNSFVIFSPDYESTKLERVYQDLILIKIESQGHKMDKVVIVSQFESVLEPLKDQLWTRGFFSEIMSDAMTNMEHQLVLSDFALDPNGPDILLFLVPTLVRTKWNMEGVRYVFLLDNHWDPTMELEIFEQIYSSNQKPVTIKRFITRETVEEAIDQIRESKLKHLNEPELKDPGFYHNLNRTEIFQLFGSDAKGH